MCPTHVRLHFVAKAAMTAMALGMIMTAGVAAPVAAEQAELVKAVSVRQDMTVYRGRLYFQGMDGIDHADEPWVSGGTPSTTRMIKDVNEGQGSSYPGAFIGAGDVVWFTVQNPQQRSLWRTQGTSATTRILDHKDEMVGRPRFAMGSTLFFQGTKDDYPTTDLELWKTKGTLPTTTRVRDINPGLGSSEPGPGVKLRKQSYFAANDGKTGRELWRTSGTRASTRRVVDLWSGYLGSNPEHLTVVRDRLYFVADNGYGLGDELWVSKGTAKSTRRLTGELQSFSDLTRVGDKLYFRASSDLWVTQGTLATTHKIDLYNGGRRLGPRDLVAVGDRLHFTAITPASNTTLCWTAGTAASTDCYAPLTGSRQGPGKVAAVSSNVYFVLDDGVHGGELWRSRGTAGTVEMVADIAPGAASSWVDHLAVMGGALYFGASEGGGSHGLWKVVP